MQSIREKLISIVQTNNNDSTFSIAKELLINYDNNIFLDQNELSKNAHVSYSMATFFAKKIGFLGYRELITRMKVEKEFYNLQELETPNNKFISYQKDFFTTINNIDKQQNAIDLTIRMLNLKQNIYLFSSYEQNWNTELFANILEIKGKKVYASHYRKSDDFYVNQITSKDLALFIVSGLDNSTLIRYYERIKAKNIPIILISSNSQAHKFIDPLTKIVIKNSGKNEIYVTAKAAHFNYLFNLLLINVR